MCDYSLHGIENRLAVEGEILVVHRFYTGSKGLTSPSYLQSDTRSKNFLALLAESFVKPSSECAVCIPDGAELILTGIPQSLQFSAGVLSAEVVIFRQQSLEDATHRDAVEFSNGQILLLQELEEGQRVGVVALSSEAAMRRALELLRHRLTRKLRAYTETHRLGGACTLKPHPSGVSSPFTKIPISTARNSGSIRIKSDAASIREKA